MEREIAAVILTLNEAQNIQAAVESIRACVDSVIVVDSGSSDDTTEIARVAGAHVLVHPPQGGFVIADQRNWALRELKGKFRWVLFMDADERATPEFMNCVAEATANDSLCDGFWAAPQFLYQGTWLKRFKGFPNWHPRLVRVGSCWIEGGVWERFPDGVKLGFLSEPYLHNVDSKGLSDWVERHLRYAAWEARLPKHDESQRRARLRRIAGGLGPFRPVGNLVYSMIIRRGVLDGGSVWSYARRQFIYDLLVLEARREARVDR